MQSLSSPTDASIFFVTLPKSGTVYTWNTLKALTGLAEPNLSADREEWFEYASGIEYNHSTIYASGDFFTQRLLPDRLKQFLPNGFIFGAHMPPIFHNINALESAGVKKIIVTLRDPRDATVSWAHHVQGRGPQYTNYQSKIYPLTPSFFEQEYSVQLSHHVRNFLPMAVTWIESWLDFYADPDRKIDVHFSYYDDLKNNPHRYFERILSFFGRGAVDTALIPAPEKGKRHFREGRHGAWEDEFSPSDKIFSEHLINSRLTSAYDRAAAIWANSAEREPDSTIEAKLKLALSGLNQFPSSDRLSMICAEYAAALHGDQRTVRTLSEKARENTPTEGLFVIDDTISEAAVQLEQFLMNSDER